MRLKNLIAVILASVILLASCNTSQQTEENSKNDEISYNYHNDRSVYDNRCDFGTESDTVVVETQNSEEDNSLKIPNFSTINGNISFNYVYEKGMANIYDSAKAYAVLNDDSDDANRYDVYQTTDAGDVWLKTQTFYLDGEISFAFKEENGQIIWFINSDEKTQVYILSVNKTNHVFEINKADDWFSAFRFSGDGDFDVSAVDNGDYYIHLIVTEKSENKNILYQGDVILSESDLYPYSIIPDETAPYDEMLNTIKSDTVNFSSLVEKGLANVTAKYKAYYLDKEATNSEHLFRITKYITVDGGKTWIKRPEVFVKHTDENNYSFTFKNGKTMYITSQTINSINIVDTYSLTGEDWLSALEIDKYFTNIEAERIGEYTLQMRISKENSETSQYDVLFEGMVILDEDTLYPAQVIKHEMKNYTSALSTIDQDNNDFSRQLSFGCANVYENNRAYIIKFTGAGAGGREYKKIRTEDGGKTWIDIDDEKFRIENSNIYSTSFDNGRILWICNPCISYSSPFVMLFDMYEYQTQDETNGYSKPSFSKSWFKIFNIPDDITFFAETDYKGDYIMHIKLIETVRGEKTDNILFDGDIIINEKSLFPKEIADD